MIRLLKTAVARIQDAQAAMPSDLDTMACDLGDLDELLGVLSSYTRRLSSAVESLHDLTEDGAASGCLMFGRMDRDPGRGESP